jgi:hypothetical protein
MRIGIQFRHFLDRVFDALTTVLWIASAVTVLLYGALFIAPDLNPLAEWRPLPAVFVAYPTPVLSIASAATATPRFPPTWTPEPTLIPSTATSTATATRTPPFTATPSLTPSATATPTATQTSAPTAGPSPTACSGARCPTPTATLAAMAFTLPPEAPVYTANASNQNGCAWMGVIGRVLDKDGRGINGLFILIEGNGIDVPVPTGPTRLGAGSYEITLANAPAETAELYVLTLLDGSNQPLSASYYVPTFDDCKRNQLRIDFVQNH